MADHMAQQKFFSVICSSSLEYGSGRQNQVHACRTGLQLIVWWRRTLFSCGAAKAAVRDGLRVAWNDGKGRLEVRCYLASCVQTSLNAHQVKAMLITSEQLRGWKTIHANCGSKASL